MKQTSKKVISLVAVLLIVMFSCVSAFAAESPTGSKDVNVIIRPTGGGTGTYDVEVVYGEGPNGGKVINFYPKPNSEYTFEKWELKGDYDIIKGSLDDPEFTIEAYSDIEATPYYTKAGATSSTVVSNTGKTSPQTSDNTYVVFALVAVIAASAGVVVVKRRIDRKG
ncbi:MAG: LPXTG cell wall anchor domain-containing protein [Oscillospiraceae bacterium]|nr:LPXTG cell wall anchor domain-containing protein [Oscillospiraceae bacterium]